MKLVQLTLWEEKQNQLSPYWLWEDYLAGMYKATDSSRFNDCIELAIHCLADESVCELAMRRCVREWPIAALQNLHDKTKNRRPWMGRASCCIQYGVREDAVRVAWWELTDDQRDKANLIADEIIKEWEMMNA